MPQAVVSCDVTENRSSVGELNSACSTDGFYIAPKMGEIVHKLPQSLGTCPASTAPTSTSIHLWKMVECSSSQSLQITIVLAGQAPFLSQLVFPATYATPSTGTPASADVNQIDSRVIPVNDANNAKKKSIGRAAAGVLILLLFIYLCIAVWFKMQRAMGKAKRN